MSALGTVIIAAPSTIVNPPSGSVTFFLDSTNGNILSYKTSTGSVYEYNASNSDVLAKECACMLAKEIADGVMCNFKKGLMTITELSTFLATGYMVSTIPGNSGQYSIVVGGAVPSPVPIGQP